MVRGGYGKAQIEREENQVGKKGKGRREGNKKQRGKGKRRQRREGKR